MDDSARLRGPRTAILAELIVLTAIGLLVRLVLLAVTDFPPHDGGMFYAIIGDIRAQGMSLPSPISYNGGVIPFDYPPLAFWLAAWSPFDAITALRVFPLVASTLSVPVFYCLVRAVRDEGRVPFVATVVYAMTPAAWSWTMTGGGLTRATGLLAAMVAVWQLLRVCQDGRLRNAVMAGVAAGLAVLTHPEAAVFVAMSGLLLAAALVRRTRTLGMLAIAAGVSLLVVAPWLAYLAVDGRLLQMLSAGAVGADASTTAFSVITLSSSYEAVAPVTLLLAFVGVLVLLGDRQWLVPAWIGAELLLAARGAAGFEAIPLCIAAGIGLEEGVLRRLLRLDPASLASRRVSRVALYLVAIWLALDVPLLMAIGNPPRDALSPEDRAGMTWIRQNTPQGARLVVVSGMTWSWDYVAEWAPALTDRVSLSTMQGYEWLGGSAWQARLNQVVQLNVCADQDAACVDAWLRANAPGNDIYVLVPRLSTTGAILRSVAGSPDFRVVWRRNDLLVAHWLAP